VLGHESPPVAPTRYTGATLVKQTGKVSVCEVAMWLLTAVTFHSRFCKVGPCADEEGPTKESPASRAHLSRCNQGQSTYSERSRTNTVAWKTESAFVGSSVYNRRGYARERCDNGESPSLEHESILFPRGKSPALWQLMNSQRCSGKEGK
jgi:hypothetical protein